MSRASHLIETLNPLLQKGKKLTGKGVGYKIMTLKDSTGKLHSMADSRHVVALKKNQTLTNRQGFWLGTTEPYVKNFYGSGYGEDPEEMEEGEYEMYLTYSYDAGDVVDGDPTSTGSAFDQGAEFSVSKAKLVGAYNVTTGKKVF